MLYAHRCCCFLTRDVRMGDPQCGRRMMSGNAEWSANSSHFPLPRPQTMDLALEGEDDASFSNEIQILWSIIPLSYHWWHLFCHQILISLGCQLLICHNYMYPDEPGFANLAGTREFCLRISPYLYNTMVSLLSSSLSALTSSIILFPSSLFWLNPSCLLFLLSCALFHLNPPFYFPSFSPFFRVRLQILPFNGASHSASYPSPSITETNSSPVACCAFYEIQFVVLCVIPTIVTLNAF